MTRIVDPVVADLQAEWGQAERSASRRLALRVVYTVSLARALLVNAWTAQSAGALADERPGLRAVLVLALATTCVVTGMLGALQWRFSQHAFMVVAIPESLVLAVPVGVAVGLTIGGRALSRRLRWSSVALGLAGSVATFVVVSWLLPAAWQSYAKRTGGGMTIYLESGQTLRDPSEMTSGEISEWLRRPRASDGAVVRVPHGLRRLFEMRYCERVSISLASLSVAILGLAGLTRRRIHGGWSTVIGLASPIAFAAAFAAGEAAFSGGFSAWTIVWVPHLACLSAAFLLVRTAESRGAALSPS
jgi:hypothetical protein